MDYILDRTGTPEGLSNAISTCFNRFSPKALMILAGNKNGFTPKTIDPILHTIPVPTFGGLFPGILHNHDLLEQGTLVIALPTCPQIQVIHRLHDEGHEFDNQLDENFLGETSKTMFVFVDGLAMRVGSLLSSLFCLYGMEINYIGGGAGALQVESTPCLMTNDGLIRDAAILAVLDLQSSVGISHGLESVSGPHMVSNIRGNRIGSIDWQPARTRFQEIISEVDPTLIDEKGFPISNDFCLAINRIDGEKVVRDPFMADPDGSLHVVTQLNEGGFIDIMRAKPNAMIQAAGRALDRARSSFNAPQPYESMLCFDCFTRWHFLGDRYSEEIEALQDKRCTLLGALTLGGEIANCGMDFLDYYNRTCVVSVLEGFRAKPQ